MVKGRLVVLGYVGEGADRNGILVLNNQLLEFHVALLRVKVGPHCAEILRHLRAAGSMADPGKILGSRHIPIAATPSASLAPADERTR